MLDRKNEMFSALTLFVCFSLASTASEKRGPIAYR